MQLEYRYVRMVSSLTSPPTPAAPGNQTEYQQTTCTMQFSPCLFLHGSCSGLHTCWKKQVRWIMLAKVFPRLVGRVKLVWYSLCILVMKSAIRIWICLEGCHHSLHHQHHHHQQHQQHQQHHATTQNTNNKFCNDFFSMFVLAWVLFCFTNMLKETGTVDYVGQGFPKVGWYGKTCLNSLLNLV